MITRLIVIAIAGVTLTGYAPRWLATSDQAWIIWVTAAAFVLMGPRLLRYAIKSLASSRMKATEVNNAAFQGGRIREDGSYVRPVYVYRVKKPDESRYPWDYYTLVKEVPDDEAFLSLKDQGCPNPTK